MVADHLVMLMLDLLGGRHVRAQHKTDLQKQTGRNCSSIDFKHQNISAILMRLEEICIFSYKPEANFQAALIDGVARHLFKKTMTLPVERRDTIGAIREGAGILIGPRPSLHLPNEEPLCC